MSPKTGTARFDSSKVVFFGSPPLAVASLEALLASGREVPIVVTQPDREAGRGRKLKAPAVKEYAVRRGLKLLQPRKMKDPAFWQELEAVDSRLFVVAAYGRILPDELLAIPDLTLNVHASLLPRWRGASPIQRAVISGDAVTGVSIMRLVKELDAGDVLYRAETAVDPDETAGELETRLSVLGAKALVEALDLLDRGCGEFKPQDPSGVTLAPPLEKEAGRVDWSRPAGDVHNRIRGMNPWPGAFTIEDGRRIKLLRSHKTDRARDGAEAGALRSEGAKLLVACGDAWLEITELQREGRNPQAAAAFLSGCRGKIPPSWG